MDRCGARTTDHTVIVSSRWHDLSPDNHSKSRTSFALRQQIKSRASYVLLIIDLATSGSAIRLLSSAVSLTFSTVTICLEVREHKGADVVLEHLVKVFARIYPGKIHRNRRIEWFTDVSQWPPHLQQRYTKSSVIWSTKLSYHDSYYN